MNKRQQQLLTVEEEVRRNGEQLRRLLKRIRVGLENPDSLTVEQIEAYEKEMAEWEEV